MDYVRCIENTNSARQQIMLRISLINVIFGEFGVRRTHALKVHASIAIIGNLYIIRFICKENQKIYT